MSVLFLCHAFNARVGNPLRKLILIKLCDNASDGGECWPSIGHIAKQCEASRRSVVSHLQALEDDGFINISSRFVANAQRSNVYSISLQKLKDSRIVNELELVGLLGDEPQKTPEIEGGADFARGAKSAPPGAPDARGGAGAAREGVQELHTEPSLGTVIEPSINNILLSGKESPKNTKIDFSVWGDQPGQQVLADWLAFRKSKKKPVNQTVVNDIAVQIKIARVQFGYSVDQCLTVWMNGGWAGFKAEWVRNALQGMQAPANFSGGQAAGAGMNSTRNVPILEQLESRDWATQTKK